MTKNLRSTCGLEQGQKRLRLLPVFEASERRRGKHEEERTPCCVQVRDRDAPIQPFQP